MEEDRLPYNGNHVDLNNDRQDDIDKYIQRRNIEAAERAFFSKRLNRLSHSAQKQENIFRITLETGESAEHHPIKVELDPTKRLLSVDKKIPNLTMKISG